MGRLLFLLAYALVATATIVPNVRWKKSLSCTGMKRGGIAAVPGEPRAIYVAGTTPVATEIGSIDHGCIEKWVEGADAAEWTYVVGEEVGVAHHSLFNAITVSPKGDVTVSGLIGNVTDLQISYGLLLTLSPNGKLVWSSVRPRFFSDCALETRVFGVTAAGHVLALDTDPCDTSALAWIDPSNGKEIAHSMLPKDVAFRGAQLSVDARTLFTLSFEGLISAYSVATPQKTSKEIWSFGKGFQTMQVVHAASTAAAANGGCIIAGCVGVCGGATLLSCDGKALWVTSDTSTIMLAQSKNRFVAVSTTPDLYGMNLLITSLDATNGTTEWTVTAPVPLNPEIGGAAFSTDGSGVFVLASSFDYTDKIADLTIRFDAETGENLWTATVGTEQDLEGPHFVETADLSLPILMGVSIGQYQQQVWSIEQERD